MPTPRWIAPLVLLASVQSIALAQPATQPIRRSWDLTPGRQWRELVNEPAPATQRSPEPGLDRVEQLLDRHEYKAASKLAIQWVLAHKDSPNRDRGLLLIARAFYGYGDRIKSFYYCDELMDEYPESDLFTPALELQYKIADQYLDGYRRRWLGIPLFQAKEEAVEMLYRIRNRAPGSPLAEKSLLRTADHYRFDGQFDFAADAYAFYAKQYPRSPMTPRARLWGAYCQLAQFRGIRFDPTPVIDAREQLRSIAAAYPDLAREENIEGILQRIDAVFARKLYTTATYYRRVREDGAAAYTYKYLMKAYPDSPESARAEMWIKELPQWARNMPGPTVIGDEGTPTAELPLLK